MNFNVERGLSTEECNNAGLTDGQRIALELMSMLPNTFILKGYAGTGKTYLLAYFLRVCKCKRILITAPTHKAVGVANGTSTIHSYLCLKMKYKEDKQIFEKAPFCENIRHGDLVIVDEASMISTELLAFLLEAQEFYDLKLIFIGDPFQIPPVGEKVSPVWELNCASFTLTEIVRQARDSNIISLATAVREGTAYTHGVNRFVNDKDVFSGDFKKMKLFYEKCIEKDVFPQIISHKNVIVDSSNKWARGMVKGHDVDDFMVGEEVYIRSVNEEQVHKLEDIVKIAAISNPYKFKIYVDNPIMVLDILIRSEKGEETLTIPFSDEDARKFVKNKEILAERARAKKAEWRTFWWYSNAISEIKHIYAMTAHRAQGSTFRNVIINCKDIPDRNLMYTAVTRASKRVFLFR